MLVGSIVTREKLGKHEAIEETRSPLFSMSDIAKAEDPSWRRNEDVAGSDRGGVFFWIVEKKKELATFFRH